MFLLRISCDNFLHCHYYYHHHYYFEKAFNYVTTYLLLTIFHSALCSVTAEWYLPYSVLSPQYQATTVVQLNFAISNREAKTKWHFSSKRQA